MLQALNGNDVALPRRSSFIGGSIEFLKQVEIVQLSDAGVATPAVSFELCPDERTVHSRMGRRISLSSS